MADANDRLDAELLVSLARQASALALTFFGRDPRSWTKNANSPVSEADIAVDRLLHDGLRAARPSYGWLSEETTDTTARLSAEQLFIVDPIDGTRSFLEGRADWTVSLAIVRKGRPVAACVVAPVAQQLFSAALGFGAFEGELRLTSSQVFDAARAKVGSPKARVGVVLPPFGETVPRIGSLALRLTRVASGALDAAFAGPGSKDWDIAAADLLIHEAGGRLSDFRGTLPLYNRVDPTHSALVAAGSALHSILLACETAEIL